MLSIVSEEFGNVTAMVANVACHSIGVMVNETDTEGKHYAEFYDDQEEFAYKLMS